MSADLEQRLAQFSPTPIDFDEKLVSPENRQVLIRLVQAAEILDEIFRDQVSPAVRPLRERLAREGAPAAVLGYYDIMYGPWDRLKGHEPFVGTDPKPLGAGYYPPDLTQSEFEGWIKAHPSDEKAFRSYFTVIRREGRELRAVPYSKAYGPRLQRAAALLKEASTLAQHPALKKYLALRAEAFLSDDYYASDVAWMELGDSPLEVVLGPYEVYEDRLLGYKAAMESFLTLRDPDYSAKLQKLARYNKEMEANLPLKQSTASRHGEVSPISVVVQVYSSGDTRASVQTAAFNLPNDERVRAEKGSKKVMLKNVTEAKFRKALIPIAQRLVDPRLLPEITFDAYFMEILLHEMAHGMGPGLIEVGGRRTEVSRELKELYASIEECKADIVGLVNAAFLIKKKALPKSMARQIPAAYLAGLFRAVRFGTEEAHAKGVLVAQNFLMGKGALTRDASSGRYGVDYARFDGAVRELARILLEIEATGSYAKAKELLDKHGVARPELKQALQQLTDLPVDIKPEYTITEKMRTW